MNGYADEVLRQLTDSFWFGVGRGSAAAFAKNQKWLFRRVEAIEFVDRRSVRRRVSVDFEVPKKLPDLGKRAAENTVLVPIAVLQKWPLPMDFHLLDQANDSISRYLRATSKQLDFGLLLGMADRALALGNKHVGLTEPDGLAPALRRKLAAIVQDPQPSQTDVAHAVNELHAELGRRLKRALERERSTDSTKIATQVVTTVDLAARLAGGSILWVPVQGDPGTDRIVKFSYIGPYYGSSPEFLEDPEQQGADEDTRWHAPEPLKRLAISCSWRRRTLHIPLLHAGRQVRYHLDLRAPEGSVEILEARAVALPPATGNGAADALVRSVPGLAKKYAGPKDAGLDVPDEWVGPESGGYLLDYGPPLLLARTSSGTDGNGRSQAEEEEEASAEIIDRRAHVYLGVNGAPSHRVLLQLKLAATRQGFIQGCAIAAVVIAVLMWFVYGRLSAAAIHIDPTVVLLSVVPIVLGYVLVRPDEQPFEYYHLRGVRIMALFSGAMPIVGALLLVLTHQGSATDQSPDLTVVRPIWLVLVGISTLTAAGLFLSWFWAAPSKDPSDGATSQA